MQRSCWYYHAASYGYRASVLCDSITPTQYSVFHSHHKKLIWYMKSRPCKFKLPAVSHSHSVLCEALMWLKASELEWSNQRQEDSIHTDYRYKSQFRRTLHIKWFEMYRYRRKQCLVWRWAPFDTQKFPDQRTLTVTSTLCWTEKWQEMIVSYLGTIP